MPRLKHLVLLAAVFSLPGACRSVPAPLPDRNFRADMRTFIMRISAYARSPEHPGGRADFMVIPQNGQELITFNGEPDGTIVTEYMAAISGTGREDLYYGYTADNKETPPSESLHMKAYLDRFTARGKQVLVTDYCFDHDKMDRSYADNAADGYISFAAPDRMLRVIPDYPRHPYPHVTEKETEYPVQTPGDARNFLYLINPDSSMFPTKNAFLAALANTNYDIIIMDAFYGDEIYTKTEIDGLKTKKNGCSRLIIAYMSIGEAENYRYYWKPDWNVNPPAWLGKENPHWEGNYKVRYWEKGWQDIIVSGSNSYVQKIMTEGFDGVYLDIIDAFEYFEDLQGGDVPWQK